MNKKIKTVIFDIGNVLVGYDWDVWMMQLFNNDRVLVDRLKDALFEQGVWIELDRGVWSWEQLIDGFVSYAPDLKNEIVYFMDNCGGALWQFDFTKDLIKDLKARGYQVLFLSNWSDHMKEQAKEQLDFLPLMDGGIFSCDVKLVKPDHAIYETILREYKLDPAECVFLDDSKENIQGARECGLNVIHVDYKNQRAALVALEELLDDKYKFYGWQDACNVKASNKLYKGIETPIDLYNKLKKVWCADTCAPRMREEWTPENMTLGQCSITAFLAQDIFGGEVYAMATDNGGLHCYNKVDGVIFDLTCAQFGEKAKELVYDCSMLQDRESKDHFAKEEKRQRYEYIKSRLPEYIEGHLYYVRHGQTVWNVENKICGATDSPLTEEGRQQARDLAKHILDEGIHFDEILYSPLSRARDTAMEISKLTGVSARPEVRLVEQDFGKWESTARNGADFKEAKKQFAISNEGGESMLFLCQRIYNLIDELKQDKGKVYLLVAHNGIARAVNSYFNEMTNEEYGAFGIDNCQIVRYDF